MATFITKIKPRKYGLEGFFLIVGRGFEAGKLLEAIRQWGVKGGPTHSSIVSSCGIN